MNLERKRLLFDLTVMGTASLLALALLAGSAEARSRTVPPDNATWRAECGSCHLAYPPALLPAAEWRLLVASLDRHFGVDASIDAKSAGEIEGFLAASAGPGGPRAFRAQPRITTTRWFLHKHDEIPAALFRSPGVRTPANCAACHGGAAAGNFNEHAVAIPH